MDEFLNQNNIQIQEINLAHHSSLNISLHIARLDLIHPVVSGNKLFKLHFFLKEAKQKSINTIITYGGAYSNHLVATAYACQCNGLRSIGIVRGEAAPTLSHTLKACMEYGMELKYISREAYKLKDESDISSLSEIYGPCIIIPEGGYHTNGALGAGLIMDMAAARQASHICTAVGTATTLAGLLRKSLPGQQIIGVPVIRNMKDIPGRMEFLQANNMMDRLALFTSYDFGGYAKYTDELIQFMNQLFIQYHLPTDFIYTAKMMFGVFDQIQKGYFAPGSRILCLHTGGLQGNLSLPVGTLLF